MSERLAQRVLVTKSCWEWTGQIDRDGYGRLRGKLAHRLVYESLVGPIPAGLDLDHLCRNKRCVNPAHLEPVTTAENNRRASALRTNCRHGHALTPENTYRPPSWPNRRYCRTCNRAAVAAYAKRRTHR